MRPSKCEVVLAGLLALGACRPGECQIEGELFGEKVTVVCELDDDRYDCDCAVGKTDLESFGSDDVCALSEDEQKDAAEDKCAPELDDCIFLASAFEATCNAQWSCGLFGGVERGVSVECDGITCLCSEDTDRDDDDFTGERTGDFDQADFCDVVAAWQDDGASDAESDAAIAEMNVLVAAGCGLEDADF